VSQSRGPASTSNMAGPAPPGGYDERNGVPSDGSELRDSRVEIEFAHQNCEEAAPSQTRASFNSLLDRLPVFGGERRAYAEKVADHWSLAPEPASARSVDQALAIRSNELDQGGICGRVGGNRCSGQPSQRKRVAG
jgi:hypothetical protein